MNLSTTDTNNIPVDMLGTVGDTTAVVTPVINGTSITTASTNTLNGAVELFGIGVNPTISNMLINGGGYNLLTADNASGTFTGNTFNGAITAGAEISGGASPTLINNIIRNSTTGVALGLGAGGQAGAVTLNNNKVVNNAVGIDIYSTVSAIVENNLIRGNGSIGILIDSPNQTLDAIQVRNNLIGENGTGIHVVGDLNAATNTFATIESNTIGASTGIAGVLFDQYTNINLNYNILSGNPTDVATQSNALVPNYNITTDNSLPTGAGFTDIYANPAQAGLLFANGFYLGATSLAINAGATATLASAGLTTTPYAEVATPDLGALDLGYHHATIAPSILTSTALVLDIPFGTGSYPIGLGGTTVITITPLDAITFNPIGAGLDVTMGITQGGAATGTLSNVKDNGDGSYEAVYTAPATGLGLGNDTINPSVNGITTTPVTITF